MPPVLPVSPLLSRRNNIRSLAEIEAARRGDRQPEGSWRTGVAPETGKTKRYVSPEELADRDRKVREMRLARHTMQDIMIALDMSYGRVQASIFRQGLYGVGGAGRAATWRVQAGHAARRRDRAAVMADGDA